MLCQGEDIRMNGFVGGPGAIDLGAMEHYVAVVKLTIVRGQECQIEWKGESAATLELDRKGRVLAG